MLIKVDSTRAIEKACAIGIPEGHREALTGLIEENSPTDFWETIPDNVTVFGVGYDIAFIKEPPVINGILITPRNNNNISSSRSNDSSSSRSNDSGRSEEFSARWQAYRSFYINLADKVMRELDSHTLVESCIINVEKNRIADEIHDTVIQKLFAIACSLRLMVMKQDGALTADDSLAELKSIELAVESTMRELREAIYGSRWDSGEENDFAEKLELYIDEIKRLKAADINLDIDSDTKYITVSQKAALYRIICEAANNAIRHGNAEIINIRVCLEERALRAEISDNGRGFDRRVSKTEGNGLVNMCRMINLLKGQLSIDSQIGKGTSVKCLLPR
jgi:signal transduction histidine kinase